MQFPELAVVAIELDGKYYTSDHHSQGHTPNSSRRSVSTAFLTAGCGCLIRKTNRSWCRMNKSLSTRSRATCRCGWSASKIDEAVRERLKEITCLYEIRRGMGLELSMDGACQQIFKHLIPAMQFPEIATAVIELDGRRFHLRDVTNRAPAHELQAKISASNSLSGRATRILSPRQAFPDT